MKLLHRALFGLAALIACLGMVCITAFLLAQQAHNYLLYGAISASLCSFILAFVGVFLACREADGRKRQETSWSVSPDRESIDEKD